MGKNNVEVILMEESKVKKKEASVKSNKKQEFRSKMELCDSLRLDKFDSKELISFKNNILFKKGEIDPNIIGTKIGLIALLYSVLAISLTVVFKIIEIGNKSGELWMQIIEYGYYILIVVSMAAVAFLIKNMLNKFNTQYGHNNILLDYQLKLVEEELERRKSESIESKVQSPSVQSN